MPTSGLDDKIAPIPFWRRSLEEKTIRDYWVDGHVAFSAEEDEQEYHSDVWFHIIELRTNGSRWVIEQIHNWLFYVLLEGNPDVIVEDDYDGYSFLDPVVPRLEEALKHPVALLKFSEVEPFNLGELQGKYPGKAILFNPVLTFGEEPHILLDVAKHSGAEPLGLVALVERSASGIYGWEELHVAAMMRRETNLWKPEECPLCQAEEPFLAIGLSRG